MSSNLYAECPCGSGKKVKFCCSREIIGELERVQRMIEGEQAAAALAKILSLEKRHPKHPALLAMKFNARWTLGQMEQLAETSAEFLEAAPDNPFAIMSRAVVTLLDGRLKPVLDIVQDAMEAATDGLSFSALNVLALIVRLLAHQDMVGPLSGYCVVLDMMAQTEEQEEIASSAISEYLSSHGVPLLLKNMELPEVPDRGSWRREYQQWRDAAQRGCFRKAAAGLEQMAIRILDEPVILEALACVNWWLGNYQRTQKAMAELAQIRSLPNEVRVESLAIAQLLADEAKPYVSQRLRIEFAVTEHHTAIERLQQSLHLSEITKFVRLPAQDDDQPRPLALFELLDRPPSEKPLEEWDVEDVPLVTAQLEVFGRETDRPARLVITGDDVPGLPALDLTLLRELLGDVLGDELDRSEEEGTRIVDRLLVLRIPAFMVTKDFLRTSTLATERARRDFDNALRSIPFPELDGKSLPEAVKDPQGRLAAQALLLRIESYQNPQVVGVDLNGFREELGLPRREPLRVDSKEQLTRLAPYQFSQLDVQALDDELLTWAFVRALAYAVPAGLRLTGREILARSKSSSPSDISLQSVCMALAATPFRPAERLQYIEKGRDLAVDSGESPAVWLLSEAELRLSMGDAERGIRLVNEVVRRHRDQPGVAERLVNLMQRFGMVPQDGRHIARDPEPSPAAEAGEGRIWTPDEEVVADKPSKLWVPGQ